MLWDELPTTMTFELGDDASLSVASIPFHFRYDGVMPAATIFWKSAIPLASIVTHFASVARSAR